MNILTEKQEKVLSSINDFISKYWKSPTIDELTIILGQKSKRGVIQYLEVLEKKWFISRWRSYRSISLWNSNIIKNTYNISILWYVNAGTPLIDATQSDYWVLSISKKIISWNENNYFFLRVEGTSMNNYTINWKNIESSDYVLIKKNDIKLNEKDAFVFIVNWSSTLKKYKRVDDYIYLLPDSKDDFHKPIILSSKDDIIINWKLIDVFKFDI